MAEFVKVVDDLKKMMGAPGGPVALGLQVVGDELLRLSSMEVPHDKGMLQASGVSELKAPDWVQVGYHTEYAAKVHEGTTMNFQKGRKAKYLQDPFLANFPLFQKYLANELRKAFQ
jgi:hypothetical protein